MSHSTAKLNIFRITDYLRSVGKRRHNSDIVRSILKFRGSLAQAAPAELAQLTANVLIPKPESDESQYGYNRPFNRFDQEFLPASPSQGPFLELLTHAPQHGLSLIHRLVDHAILFYSRGHEYGANAIIISFPDGERVFPWEQSYWWSRGVDVVPYSITSALMALEAWAHRRIEDGEPFEKVLADVLGPPNSPAAYLLLAVDLLLSHWPKSREAAIPFLACPELLCIDHKRQVYDNIKYSDFFGIKDLEEEPLGTVSLEGLKKRPSRRHILEELLGQYAVYEPVELSEKIKFLLRQASIRLGPPDEQSNFADPAFMAVVALNLVDPDNWREVSVTLANGAQVSVHQYVPPEAESRHLTTLQEGVKDRLSDSNMQTTISLALEDPSRSSPEFAAAAVEWAQRAMALPKSENTDEDWIREHVIISAAMIVMRDGDTDLRARHSEWAHNLFAQAMQTEEDPGHQIRPGLLFNPFAIAFVGMIYALKDRYTTWDVRTLLEVAALKPAVAPGFGAAAVTLASIDERLPRAVLRCAFAGRIRPSRIRELPNEEVKARSENCRQRVQATIDAELAWLADERPEPDWPAFPPEMVRRRQGIRLPAGRSQQDTIEPQDSRPDEYVNHQATAHWLRNIRGLVDITKRPWLREIVRTYGPWTAALNGAGLEADGEVDFPPREWNDSYFDLMAYCLPGLGLPEIEQLTIAPIRSLPDEPFFDIVTQFLQSLDKVYFNDLGFQESIAISIRSAFANRLMASSGWKRLGSSQSTSVEWHLGPAIAALFFNYYGYVLHPAKCYLLPKAIDRLDSFLPVLEKLVESGPSLFVAVVTINLLEVSPRSVHLPFLVTAAKTWLGCYPHDKTFWVDHGIGRRVCSWIEKAWGQEPTLLDKDMLMRFDVNRLLSALISLGVADARRLEEALDGRSGNRG